MCNSTYHDTPAILSRRHIQTAGRPVKHTHFLSMKHFCNSSGFIKHLSHKSINVQIKQRIKTKVNTPTRLPTSLFVLKTTFPNDALLHLLTEALLECHICVQSRHFVSPAVYSCVRQRSVTAANPVSVAQINRPNSGHVG